MTIPAGEYKVWHDSIYGTATVHSIEKTENNARFQTIQVNVAASLSEIPLVFNIMLGVPDAEVSGELYGTCFVQVGEDKTIDPEEAALAVRAYINTNGDNKTFDLTIEDEKPSYDGPDMIYIHLPDDFASLPEKA